MEERMDLRLRDDFDPVRKAARRFAAMDYDDRTQAIAADSRHGHMICSCEEVTEADVIAAIHNPLGVSTLTGIKYRTRAMMGGCQSGFCQMKIEQLIEKELGMRPEDVRYMRKDSWILSGKMREGIDG